MLLSAPIEVGMEIADVDSQIRENMHNMQNSTQVPNGTTDFSSDYLYSLKNDELYRLFHSLGDQLLNLWSTFLKFHRANKTKVMDHLRNSYAIDRRAEWSIWMVYSKVEMPQQPTRNEIEDSLYHGLCSKSPRSP
nr:hypothetical protein [Tanacetum cinerariifolium]